MMHRREHEPEAVEVDRARDALRRELEPEPERLDHVGRARRGRDRAVSVLRDGGAGRSGDDPRSGRDVERPRPVSARPGRVHEVAPLRPHRKHVAAHRLRAPRDLGRRLPLRTQRDEEAGDLRRCRLAAHDLVHDGASLVAGKVTPVEEPSDRLLDHAAKCGGTARQVTARITK